MRACRFDSFISHSGSDDGKCSGCTGRTCRREVGVEVIEPILRCARERCSRMSRHIAVRVPIEFAEKDAIQGGPAGQGQASWPYSSHAVGLLGDLGGSDGMLSVDACDVAL